MSFFYFANGEYITCNNNLIENFDNNISEDKNIIERKNYEKYAKNHLGTFSLYEEVLLQNLKFNIKKNSEISIYYKNRELIYYNGTIKLKEDNNEILLNDPTKVKFHQDKIRSLDFLKEFKIPIPKRYYSFNKKGIDYKSVIKEKDITFPCVLKQSDGYKSDNVFVNIKSYLELINKINFLKSNNIINILIEDMILGKNYRIYVINDKVVDIVYRGHVNVIGNGVDNIENLIIKKNKYHESINFYRLNIDKKYVEKKYKNLKYIAKLDEIISLNPINIPINGCIPERIDISTVHTDNLELFKKINKVTNLCYCGIDFITPDLSKSYKEIKCAINEINVKSPSIELHYLSDLNKNKIVAKNIIEIILKKYY